MAASSSRVRRTCTTPANGAITAAFRRRASRAASYAAFSRAVREAVRRINANKRGYLHYFIDYHGKDDPEIAALTIDDLRESRVVVCDPAPIPLDEMQRTFDWLKSWGMLEATASPFDLVNLDLQTQAHHAAFHSREVTS